MSELLRVLLVEDNPGDVELIRELLPADGPSSFQVRNAPRLATALQWAEEDAFDIVLLDLGLPDSAGLDTVRAVRRQAPSLPIVVLTGTDDQRLGLAAIQEGAQDYAVKGQITGALLSRILRYAQERHQNLQRLRESEERLSFALEASRMGFWDLDLADHTANRSLEHDRIFGYEFLLPEWTYERFLDHVVPEDRAVVDEKFQGAVAARGDWGFECRIRRADGEIRWIWGVGHHSPSSAGRPRMAGLVQDITQRKEAEEVLESQHALLTALLNSAKDITVFSLDRNYCYTSFNEAHRKEMQLVWHVDLEIEMNLLDSMQDAELRELTQKSIDRALNGESFSEIQHQPESDTYYESNWNPIVQHAHVVGATAFIRDVTEHKQAGEAMLRRLAELEALHTVSGALRMAQTRDEALPLLLEKTLAVLETDSGAAWLYDQDRGELHPTVSRGWFQSMDLAPTRPGESVVGTVFANRQTHVSAELARDPLVWEPGRGTPEGWGAICVPLRTGEIAIGVLLVSLPTGHPITAHHVALVESLAEMGGAALHRMSLYEDTVRQLDRLQAMHNVDQAISSSTDLRMTLSVLLEHVATQLKVDATDVLLLNPHTLTLEPAAGRGLPTRAEENRPIRLGESLAGRAVLERQAVHTDDPARIQADQHLAALRAGQGIAAYSAVPLIAKGQVIGVLEVFHRSPFAAGPDWVGLLETLAGQAAIAIENAQLFDHLQRSNIDLALAYDATIEGWSHALDLRDRETEGHTLRVTEITMRLARAMGIADAELVHVRRGALLHDIGKMGVPDTILLKPGPLTEEEWVIMRRHPQLAYDLLSPITYLHPALDIPYCHHERWDGTGYPRGLKGEQIPVLGRLFAVVDVWDALRSDRPYRPAWTEEKALEHIRSSAGTHFDPKVVGLFLDILDQV